MSTPALTLTFARRLLGVWPPSTLIWAALTLALLVVGCSIHFAQQQPHWNLQLTAVTPELPPRIADPDTGDTTREILALRNAGGAEIWLLGSDLSPEPDVAFADYVDFNRFFERQRQIAELLRGDSPQLIGIDGPLSLPVSPQRPLSSLPWLFWFQLFCGFASWLTGASIWAFRRQQIAAHYCALSAFGALLMTATAAVYSTRELVLPVELFRALSSLNHFGALLCGAAFTAMVWHYPQRLGPHNPSPWLLAGALLIWILDWRQWLPFGNSGVHSTIVVLYAMAAVFALLQWRATEKDPIQRAALQWFLLSWFIASGMFLIVVSLPAIIGNVNTGQAQAYAFGMLPLISAGMALGIARYRLFDLAEWWFYGVLTVVSGSALLLLDVLFVAALKLDETVSLLLALALSGWAYLPLRQWLLLRFLKHTRRIGVRDVPQLLREVLSDHADAVERLLPEAMRRVFSPLQLEPLPESPTQVRIVEDGTGLQVPGLPGHSAWSVRWADQGTRLFNRRDADTAEAILAVLGHVATYQTAVERGVQQERSRVAQDLHDDIGARLLTLLHRSQGDTAAAVREVLASLRLSVYGLSAKPRPLAEAFASWRAEASERCEALGTELRWHETAPWPRIKLGSLQELDLARTLREALSNALRHGDRSAVEITLTPSASHLSLSIINRSEDSLPQHWRSGMGLRGMRQRLQRLGGSLQLHGEGGRICLRIELPLSAATQVAK